MPGFFIPPHALQILEENKYLTDAHPRWKRTVATMFHKLPRLNRIRDILFHMGLYLAGVSFLLVAEKDHQ
jgi:hypothetical protein